MLPYLYCKSCQREPKILQKHMNNYYCCTRHLSTTPWPILIALLSVYSAQQHRVFPLARNLTTAPFEITWRAQASGLCFQTFSLRRQKILHQGKPSFIVYNSGGQLNQLEIDSYNFEWLVCGKNVNPAISGFYCPVAVPANAKIVHSADHMTTFPQTYMTKIFK